MFESLEKRQYMTANLSSSEPGLLTVFGTLGSDTISISKLNDGRIRVNENGTLKNFAGADVTKIWVVAGSGNDSVSVSSAINRPVTLDGGNGNDTLTGGNGNDYLLGEAGNDSLNARDGNDFIYGGTGNDLLRGGNGNDNLNGEAGKDTIYAGAGADYVDGGDNNDLLVAVGGGNPTPSRAAAAPTTSGSIPNPPNR